MAKPERNRTPFAAAAIVAMAILAGCASDRGPHPDLPPLGARFEFLSKNLCSEGISPEIRLGGIPADAASYRLQISNISVVAAPRWEATVVKAETPVIPAGAIANFDAPCPGEQQSFLYRLEVMAIARDGRPLAYGWQFGTARSLTRQIEQEQAELKRRPSERPNRTSFPAAQRPPFFIQ